MATIEAEKKIRYTDVDKMRHKRLYIETDIPIEDHKRKSNFLNRRYSSLLSLVDMSLVTKHSKTDYLGSIRLHEQIIIEYLDLPDH